LLVLVSRKQGFAGAIIKDQQHPAWSAWRLEQCILRTPAGIASVFEDQKLKVVGFDIFDTLLCRPLADPEATKKIVAHQAGAELGQRYLDYRAAAESQARELAGRDIGLAEIYVRLAQMAGFSAETSGMLMALEEQVEKASLSARPGSLELFNLALAAGKQVALVSDMFLPRPLIEQSLHACGFHNWDRFFLSGEIGLRKDSGKLYEHLLEHYGIAPEAFLMVGDNERSDVQIPLDMGCRSLPVLRAGELARANGRFNLIMESNENNPELAVQLSLGMLLRQNFSPVYFSHYDPASLVQPTPFNIGYCILGPLLVSFSQWLRNTARQDGVQRLYFLSREGQLLKKVYDRWLGADQGSAESRYLVLSRRSVIVPAINKLDDILDIARVVYYPNTLKEFLGERFGLTLDDEQWLFVENNFNYKATDVVEVKDELIDRLVPLLEWLETLIADVSRQERAALMRYLESMDLLERGPGAVVDIGYSGTIQNYLNVLTGTAVHGYYLITDRKARKVARNHDVLVRGGFYANLQRDEYLPPMYEHSFDLEKLLSSNDAQIINYSQREDGEVVANFRELSSHEKACTDIRNALQAGVIKYVDDALDIRTRLLPEFVPCLDLARQVYEEFIDNAGQAETSVLSQFILDDFYCGRGLV
jgi:FMN phosphatase YigB (HAD superfamily)